MGSFDSLDHAVLLAILREKVHDERFLRLIAHLLQAGYLEDWRYQATYSGSPQGSIVSPILANIYLSKLDSFVETILLPQFNRGDRRRINPEWQHWQHCAKSREKAGQWEEAKIFRRKMQAVPSLDPQDPNYRRLRYLRYADDFLLGWSGPREEAEDIKEQIGVFLQETLKLHLSETKTLITHARTQSARFLGYDIGVLNNDQKLDRRGHRSINGQIGLRVPLDVVRTKCRAYLRHGQPIHRTERIDDSVYSIIMQFQQEYRGLAEYYQLAFNLYQLNRLKWVMERSLVATLAHKLGISIFQVYRRYATLIQTDRGVTSVLQVSVDRGPDQPPLVARWGGISLARRPKAILTDVPPFLWGQRTELEQRLLANIGELCGSQEQVEVHPIRALKDLKQEGRNEKPAWVLVMAARRRITLVCCRKCHDDIHAGRLKPPRLPNRKTLESGVPGNSHAPFGGGPTEKC